MRSQLETEAVAHYEELLKGKFPAESWAKGFVDEVRFHWVDESPMASYGLRPFMIDELEYRALNEQMKPVLRAFSCAADRLLHDKDLCRELGMPPYLESLLEMDREHGKPPGLARIDAIRSADGRLSIIEYNSEPQSVPFQETLANAFEEQAVTKEFRKNYNAQPINLSELTFHALRDRGVARGKRLPTLAILQKNLYSESPRSATWFRPMQYAASRGCRVVLADPEELEFRSGKLMYGELAIDFVAFVGWSMLINEPKRLHTVVAALKAGAAEVFAGISRGLLASNKRTLELLSDPSRREIFPSETHAALQQFIPWTRVVRERKTEFRGETIDLIPYIADNKDKFIMKPAGRGGGIGVVIGEEATSEEWTKTLKRSLRAGDVVQERVVPEKQPWPVTDADGKVEFLDVNCEYTPYAWNGAELAGVLCRITSGSILWDFGDAISIANGIDTATWLLRR